VIPARAVPRSACAWWPTQRPEEALAPIQSSGRQGVPARVTAEVKLIHHAGASLVNPDNRFIDAAAAAMQQVFGSQTVYIRSRRLHPHRRFFRAQPWNPQRDEWASACPTTTCTHPTRKFHLPNFYRGIEAVARFLEIVGQ